MSPVIKELEKRGDDYFIVHTGQHYSYNMDRIFFDQLLLPGAKYHLEVGSGSHAEQTAKMLVGIEKSLLAEKPDIVLVEGDTNTVIAGALAAVKLHIEVGHIEAGLRSFDWRMPEEVNRTLADHCAGYLFAPTEHSEKNLIAEGIPEGSIFVTGNTIVDAVYQNLKFAKQNDDCMNKLNLERRGYFLVTLHRQENVDSLPRFTSILCSLNSLASVFHLPIIYPIHPRSRKMMAEFNLKSDSLKFIDPLDYFSFLQLESEARLILTDSGGVQEESCILGVPCVTLRDNTERPETIEVGANMLAGTESENVMKCVETMLRKNDYWRNPFGDGKAGERIIKTLEVCSV